MPHLRRILALSLTVVALVASLAACGKDDISVDPVAEAATKTTGLASSRIAVNATIEAPGLPGPVPFTVTGVVDNRTQRGHFDVDFSRFAALGDGRLGKPRDFRGEMVFADVVLYMRVPLFERALPGGKEWLRVDLRKAGREVGLDLGQLSQLGQNDPSQSLRYLRAVSGDTKRFGTERVRGVPTTRYRATIDLRKYPSIVAPDQRARARASVDRLIELSGTRSVPTEVWVDDRRTVRRLRQSYAMKATPGSAQRARTTQTIEFFDFGVEVDVEPPPREEVVDFTDLTRRADRR